jgi:hypothetical protein
MEQDGCSLGNDQLLVDPRDRAANPAPLRRERLPSAK